MIIHATRALDRRRVFAPVALDERCTTPNCEPSDTSEDPIRPPDPPGSTEETEASASAQPSIGDLLKGAPGGVGRVFARFIERFAGLAVQPALA